MIKNQGVNFLLGQQLNGEGRINNEVIKKRESFEGNERVFVIGSMMWRFLNDNEMVIFLGKPRVGKTTVIKNYIDSFPLENRSQISIIENGKNFMNSGVGSHLIVNYSYNDYIEQIKKYLENLPESIEIVIFDGVLDDLSMEDIMDFRSILREGKKKVICTCLSDKKLMEIKRVWDPFGMWLFDMNENDYRKQDFMEPKLVLGTLGKGMDTVIDR